MGYTDDRSVGSDEPLAVAGEGGSAVVRLAHIVDTIPDVIETDRDTVLFYMAAEHAVRQAKALLERVKAQCKAYMCEHKIYSLEISDTAKLIYTKKKKDVFATDFIYDALAFTQEQRAVLPKNPSWRKTAILANDKTSCAHAVEEADEWELKEFDSKYLK